MFLFKKRHLMQELRSIILPCLEAVKDDLGNVPVAMHKDEHVLGALQGLICSHTAANGVKSEKDTKIVIDQIFELIFRRESTSILKFCDEAMQDKSSVLFRQFNANFSEQGIEQDKLTQLTEHVNKYYEKEEYIFV